MTIARDWGETSGRSYYCVRTLGASRTGKNWTDEWASYPQPHQEHDENHARPKRVNVKINQVMQLFNICYLLACDAACSAKAASVGRIPLVKHGFAFDGGRGSGVPSPSPPTVPVFHLIQTKQRSHKRTDEDKSHLYGSEEDVRQQSQPVTN